MNYGLYFLFTLFGLSLVSDVGSQDRSDFYHRLFNVSFKKFKNASSTPISKTKSTLTLNEHFGNLWAAGISLDSATVIELFDENIQLDKAQWSSKGLTNILH